MTGAVDARPAEAPHPSPARRRPALPDRLWVPALAGLLLSVAFVGALLVRAEGDVSLLVHAAPPWTVEADGTRGSLTVQPAEDGFDGQFFYRLGVAPWSTAETVEGVTHDLPALRNARWGYGALAFVASAGDPDLVPWALVGLNVAAAAAVGAIGGGLARTSGRHAAWGTVFVLWPGFAYSLSLDTSELVASAFLLGGLLALRHRRWVGAAALLTAAVLTRDTTAGIPFGIAVAGGALWWTSRRAPRPATPHPDEVQEPDRSPTKLRRSVADVPLAAGWVVAGVVPLAGFGAWQLLQRARFGALPLTSSGDNNLSAPLSGLADQLASLAPPSGGEEVFRLVCVVGLVGLLALAAWCWPTTSASLAERVAWLPAVAVVVLLNAYLWSGATAFMRAATEAGLLSLVLVLGARRRALPVLAGTGLAGLWLLTAVAQLSKLG